MSSFDSELSTAEDSTDTILPSPSLLSSISHTLTVLINHNINQDNYSKVLLLQSHSPFSAPQVPQSQSMPTLNGSSPTQNVRSLPLSPP